MKKQNQSVDIKEDAKESYLNVIEKKKSISVMESPVSTDKISNKSTLETKKFSSKLTREGDNGLDLSSDDDEANEPPAKQVKSLKLGA